jgi:hypothetical protein
MNFIPSNGKTTVLARRFCGATTPEPLKIHKNPKITLIKPKTHFLTLLNTNSNPKIQDQTKTKKISTNKKDLDLFC